MFYALAAGSVVGTRVLYGKSSRCKGGRGSASTRRRGWYNNNTTTGLVREVWVQELAVNEQPLLPEQLIKWVRLGSEGLSPDVATILRSLTPWLES